MTEVAKCVYKPKSLGKLYFLNTIHDSVVTQWKRAGLITLKSPDRNRATLNFFSITSNMI